MTFAGDAGFKLQRASLLFRLIREGMIVTVLSQYILARVSQALKASVMIFKLLRSGVRVGSCWASLWRPTP